jgi:CRISPR-associated protein Cas6
MPVVDLSFVIQGNSIPLDHGYFLFSSLSRRLPCIHELPSIGVHPIKGNRIEPGLLRLCSNSRLKLRVASEVIGELLPLAGSEIDLNGHFLTIGIPSMEPLTPAPALAARMVTLKGMMEPDTFLDSIKRHLFERQIQATPTLVPAEPNDSQSKPIRRVVRIQGRTVVGFALRVTGLTADESIRLQEVGLGGRRHMGCGVFVPY